MISGIVADKIFPAEAGVHVLAGRRLYMVHCCTRCQMQLTSGPDGDSSVVLTRLEIADDTLVLVGFASEERRRLYDTVKAVPGIGRRSALHVLDCGEPLDILRAVAGRDQAFFRTVPGLGPKKIGALLDVLNRRFVAELPSPLAVPVSAWVQARDVLVANGLTFDDAERTLHKRVTQRDGLKTAADLLRT